MCVIISLLMNIIYRCKMYVHKLCIHYEKGPYTSYSLICFMHN